MTIAEFCEQRFLRYHAVSPSTRQEYGYAVKPHRPVHRPPANQRGQPGDPTVPRTGWQIPLSCVLTVKTLISERTRYLPRLLTRALAKANVAPCTGSPQIRPGHRGILAAVEGPLVFPRSRSRSSCGPGRPARRPGRPPADVAPRAASGCSRYRRTRSRCALAWLPGRRLGLAAAPMKAVAAILNPPPVPGRLVRAGYRTSSAIRRLSGRGPRLSGRGPGRDAPADSGEGLVTLT